MTITDRITQARHDRDARRAARAALQKLTAELSAYTTPADRLEIELLAARSTAPGSEIVRGILDGLAATETTRTR